jgi:gluconate 2-dehydrogenase gamma chain
MRRRNFILAASAAVAAGGAGCGRSPNPWRFLTPAEAKTLEAITEQIIPGDRDPGARWAGVVRYIDRQLIRRFQEHQELYRRGLAAVEKSSRILHGRAFTDLSGSEQTELLALLEKGQAPGEGWKALSSSQFFGTVISHTMQGFYGDPRHGGNRDDVGRKLLGIAHPPVRGRQLYGFRVPGERV